jgi:UDP-N-acetylglucosamine--N-acetylmuramyl-(pentapeptide) pyrophosphoryl-undecaprenol N-acetylglucosamine transferase
MIMGTTHHRLLVAGGGTGGHLFPGIAVADEWRRRFGGRCVLFVGTGRPFERRILDRAGYPHRRVWAAGVKGMGWWRQLKAMAAAAAGVVQSVFILRGFRPLCVLAVGGYASGPVALAAWLMRIPVTLHEQNTIAGITNRLLAPLARRVYVSFPDTRISAPPEKTVFTGNPVRSGFTPAAETAQDASAPMTVMILGGSQGARGINRAVAAMLPELPEPRAYRFVHQTGAEDEALLRRAYAEAGIRAEVAAFFHDMPGRYRAADLLICRAGATTIAELTAMGRAAVLVPFPHAADNHQVVNASALVAAAAAEMIEERDLDAGRLAACLNRYRNHPELLARMRRNAAKLGKPAAAETIVDDILRVVGQSGTASTPRQEQPHVS